MSRKTTVVAIALLLALALAGCGSYRDALTIYSGRTQNLIGPLLEQFNKETGIAIDVKYGDSAELALLLDEEGDRTPADVFLSQSPGATGFLAGKGHLGQLRRRRARQGRRPLPQRRRPLGRHLGTPAGPGLQLRAGHRGRAARLGAGPDRRPLRRQGRHRPRPTAPSRTS